MSRGQELAANLTATHERIARACDAAGRDPGALTLIVVTKTWPTSDIEILLDLGVRDIGESKEQEGRLKHEVLGGKDVRWHFIGQVQRNKARKIAEWAEVIHSVDRAELIPLLNDRQVFMQINLDQRDDRGGVAPAAAMELADAIAMSPLHLLGVMAVAPLGADPGVAFAHLQQIHHDLLVAHPQARSISAGMSGDLESAIAHGATHVRLGSSILGSRPAIG